MQARTSSLAPCRPVVGAAVRTLQRRSLLRMSPRAAMTPDVLSTVAEVVSISSIPQEALLAGGAAAVLGVGAIVFGLQQTNPPADSPAAFAAAAKQDLPRENAVLVVGSTGRTGVELVQKLLAAGRTVVAAVRDINRASTKFAAAGVTAGQQADSKGILFVQDGVDITNPSTLTADLFKGVTQVVCSVGPVYGRTPEGGFEYINGMSPERVDAEGVRILITAATEALGTGNGRLTTPVAAFAGVETTELLSKFGGSSTAAAIVENDALTFKGELAPYDGVSFGMALLPCPANLASTDGLQLRVRGDGQTYKLLVKTEEEGEDEQYQALVETTSEWQTQRIPWTAFVRAKQGVAVEGAPLNPATFQGFGIMLCSVDYNMARNTNAAYGPYELQVERVEAYTEPRSKFVLISSAAVERNARIGNDAGAREKDIPIVKLNPGGILNYKYEGECALRASGLPYTIVRPTGLIGEDKDEGPALLEASQGDAISGLISRGEVADVAAATLISPAAAGRTFEVRRGMGLESQGKQSTPADLARMLLPLVPDTQRTMIGLSPLPAPVAYVATKPKEAPVVTADGAADVEAVRGWIAAWLARTGVAAKEAAPVVAAAELVAAPAPVVTAPAAEVEAVRGWIAAWRARTGSVAVAAPDAPANVLEVREWIRAWRARSLEAKLPAEVEA